MKFPLVVLSIVFTAQLNGQLFVPANDNLPIWLTSGNSMDAEAADVDGDGDLDLIVATEFGRNLLFFNDGSGVFVEDPERILPEWDIFNQFTGEDSEDIGVADFDNDGDLDLLFVSEDSPAHELLQNDGTGLFTFTTYQFPSSVANGLAILDLNDDGYDDVVIGNSGQNNVYINNQDMTFSDATFDRWPINTEWTQDLRLIDLDGDGDMDILEGCDQGTDNAYINTDGIFTEENDRLPNQDLTIETRKFSLGDVDGDDDLDLFVSTVNWIGTANPLNRLYTNDGNGYFTDLSANLGEYDDFALDAVFVDYDDDGDLDMITTDFQNAFGNHHAWRNNGDGIFVDETASVFSPFAYTMGVAVLLADFNGDGKEDLYFANYQQEDDLLMCESPNSITEHPSEVNIFPVPARDTLNVQGDRSLQGADYMIYNGQGQLIHEGVANAPTFEFDCSEWPAGIYTLITELGNVRYGHNFEVVK